MDENLRRLEQQFLVQRADPNLFLKYVYELLRHGESVSLIHQVANDWISEFGWEKFDWITRKDLRAALENYGIPAGILFKIKWEWAGNTLFQIVSSLAGLLEFQNTFEMAHLNDVTDKLDGETIAEGRFSHTNSRQAAANLAEARKQMQMTEDRKNRLIEEMTSLSSNLGKNNFKIFIPAWILENIYAPRVTVTNQGWSRSNIWRIAESHISWHTQNQVRKLRQMFFRDLAYSRSLEGMYFTQFKLNFMLL